MIRADRRSKNEVRRAGKNRSSLAVTLLHLNDLDDVCLTWTAHVNREFLHLREGKYTAPPARIGRGRRVRIQMAQQGRPVQA